MLKYTFAAASSVYASTSLQRVVELAQGVNSPTGDKNNADQVMAVRVVNSTASTGTPGVLGFVFYNPNETTDKKVQIVKATVTATADRSDDAGTGGGYVCTVAFDNNTNLMDLIGHGSKPKTVTADVAAGAKPQAAGWYVNMETAINGGTMTVYLEPVRMI
jgi:hypothetical protein